MKGKNLPNESKILTIEEVTERLTVCSPVIHHLIAGTLRSMRDMLVSGCAKDSTAMVGEHPILVPERYVSAPLVTCLDDQDHSNEMQSFVDEDVIFFLQQMLGNMVYTADALQQAEETTVFNVFPDTESNLLQPRDTLHLSRVELLPSESTQRQEFREALSELQKPPQWPVPGCATSDMHIEWSGYFDRERDRTVHFPELTWSHDETPGCYISIPELKLPKRSLADIVREIQCF